MTMGSTDDEPDRAIPLTLGGMAEKLGPADLTGSGLINSKEKDDENYLCKSSGLDDGIWCDVGICRVW